MVDLKDRVFVVTGATGHLGRAVARLLFQSGARLALADRLVEEKLDEVLPDLAGSERVLAHVADLTDPGSVAALVEAVAERFGRIDGLVNVVGGFRAGSPVHELDLETWDYLFDLNARSVLLASQAVIPHLIAAGGGRIVNVGARAALSGAANMAAYSASKAVVLRLTESMAAELKAHDITVNAVLPGTIDTPPNRAEMPKADPGKWVTPEALADVIAFLCSDQARAVTGAAIPVYGKG